MTTIQKIIDAADTGQTIVLKPGRYSEKLVIEKALTLHCEGVTLEPTGAGHAVEIRAANVTIEGLTIERDDIRPGRDNLIEVRSDNATIRKCRMIVSAIKNRDDAHRCHNAGDRRAGVRLSYGKNVLLDRCEITGTFFGVHIPDGGGQNGVIRGCNIHHTVGSCIVVQPRPGERSLLIEGCKLSHSYIEDGIQFQGAKSSVPVNFGTVIRGCSFVGNSENALDFKGTGSAIVENCLITQTIGSNDGALSGWNNPQPAINIGTGDMCENIIVRNNVIFNNGPGVLQSGENWKTYNNVIVYNNFSHRGPQTGGNNPCALSERSRRGIGVKNNIMGGHWFCAVVSMLSHDYEIDHNLYFKGLDGASEYIGAIGQYPHHAKAAERMTWQAWRRRLATAPGVRGKDEHSAYVVDHDDVGFVNVAGVPAGLQSWDDFRISEASPAYQAGGPLTYVAAGGSGRAVPVVDARWFSAGFGAVEGDLITVGSTRAIIKSIDYANSVLRLDRVVEFAQNQPVFFGGSTRPHIGLMADPIELPPVAPPPEKPTEPPAEEPLTSDLIDQIRNLLDKLEWALK